METIKELIIKRLREELTPAEEQQLQSWVALSVHNRAVFEEINDPLRLADSFTKLDNLRTEETWERIINFREKETPGENISTTIPPVHRVHFLKTAWAKYAAAIIILILGATTYYFVHTSQSHKEMVQTTPSPKPNENVLPGSDRAILTLSNGQQVQLNNATSETIKDGTLSIENINGQLSYTSGGSLSPAGGSGAGGAEGGSREARTATNTMQTPKGGQYKLTLSDGTNVWLNAASSITYPIAFTSNTREVSITGEAYFEVAKNKAKPFIVSVAGLSPAGGSGRAAAEGGSPEGRTAGRAPQTPYTITVLGTEFNINTYPDEPTSKTTLIEGSIKISYQNNSKTLSPGQQSQISNNNLTIKSGIDTEEIKAWKNGYFYFDNADLKTILRQYARWYDVEIVYEGKMPDRKFFGIVKRSSSLKDVMGLLQVGNIVYRVEGKKLIVSTAK